MSAKQVHLCDLQDELNSLRRRESEIVELLRSAGVDPERDATPGDSQSDRQEDVKWLADSRGQVSRHSEERYRSFVRNSSEGIWRVDLDHPISPDWPEEEQIARLYEWAYVGECNLAMARMYGYDSPEELVGTRISDLMIASDPVNMEMLRSFIHSGYQLRDAETHERDRHGNDRYYLNSFSAVLDGRLLVRGWGIQRDITERKRTEQALRSSEERFSRFMEHLPGAAWIKDSEGRYVYGNALAESIFGTPLTALTGRTDAELFPAETARQFQFNDQQVLRSGLPLQTIETLRHPDGVDHQSIVHKFPIMVENRTHVGGIAYDITELLGAQREMRQAKEHYERIVRAAGVSIWEEDFSEVKEDLDQLRLEGVTDLKAYLRENPEFTQRARSKVRVRDVNQATVALFKAPSKEALLESLDRLFMPETWTVLEEALGAIYNGETVMESESAMRALDGEDLYVRVSMTCSPDDPRAARVVFYLMNITERRRIEKQLRKASAELEEFAYLASHDLQEPLRTVAAFTELLLSRYAADKSPDVVEFGGYIEGAVKKMRGLIHGVQVYTRAVRGEEESGVSAADLNVSLQQAMEGLSQQIEETRAEVEVENLPTVSGNQAEFTQVFRNLLENSLKYRHPDRAPRIHVGATPNYGEWRICVRDNGIGFDPKYKDRVFRLFKRLHNTAYPGAGLGLAACSRIVERHGGRIWAHSVPGEGSLFCFSCRVLSTV